jgi:hypothetical protein
MKTSTTFILAGFGLVGYIGYRAKLNAEALAAKLAARNAPLPSPSNSGPVVNGLSLYQLEGLGFSFNPPFQAVFNKVRQSAPARIIRKVSPVATVMDKVVTTVKDRKTPLNMINKLPGAVALTAKLPFVQKIGSSSSAQPAPGQKETYEDVNGKKITKAEYKAIRKARATMKPIPVQGEWAIPDGYIMTRAQYESSIYFPRKIPGHGTPNPTQSPPYMPPSYPSGTPQHNRSDNEDLNITNTYSDDYSEGPGTQHTASSAGSPALPPITTTVAPPDVTEEATMPAEAPKSNTAAALVGTALAAGAAYLAFS